MNQPRIKPLVWGSWPPRPKPLEKYSPAEDDTIAPEAMEQPAPDQGAPQDMTAPEPAAPEADSTPDQAVDTASGEIAGEADAEVSMEGQAPDEIAEAADSAEESELITRPRPPGPGPFYPPGPPPGPVSPGAPNAPYTPPGPVYPGYELARAYIPIQKFGPLFSLPEALEKGTLFPELWRPYPR